MAIIKIVILDYYYPLYNVTSPKKLYPTFTSPYKGEEKREAGSRVSFGASGRFGY